MVPLGTLGSGFHPLSVLTNFFIHLYANRAFLKVFVRKKIKSREKNAPKRHEVTEASMQRSTGESY